MPLSHTWSRGNKQRELELHAFRAVTLWVLWRCDAMAAVAGLWKIMVGKNIDSRKDREWDKEGTTPSIIMTS